MRLLFCYLVLMLGVIPIHGQHQPNHLESQLSDLNESDRIPVLEKLADQNRYDAPHNSIAYGREALLLLTHYPDAQLQIRILDAMSAAYLQLAEYEKALVYIQRARSMAVSADEPQFRARLDLYAGRIWLEQGKFDKALTAALSAWQTAELLDKPDLNMQILLLLGHIHRRMDSYSNALDYYYRALQYRQESSSDGSSSILHDIGTIHARLHNHNEALNFYQQALAALSPAGSPRLPGQYENDIGRVYVAQKEYHRALEYHFRALKRRKADDDLAGQAESGSDIGWVYHLRGKQGLALDYLLDARELAGKLGNSATGITIYSRLGRVYSALLQSRLALQHGLTALAMARETNSAGLIIDCLEHLSLICEAQQNYSAALLYQKELKVLQDSVLQSSMESRLDIFKEAYEQEKQLALQLKESELQRSSIESSSAWKYLSGAVCLFAAMLIGLLINRAAMRRRAHNELQQAYDELEVANRELKGANKQMIRQSLELHEAMSKIKTLSGFLPICSHCKDVRTDTGYWQRIESYIHEHSNAEFSHSVCPSCARRHNPRLSATSAR